MCYPSPAVGAGDILNIDGRGFSIKMGAVAIFGNSPGSRLSQDLIRISSWDRHDITSLMRLKGST